MASRNLGRDPQIGKRWPYKSLNYLPAKQLLRYLAWKSGGTPSEGPFQLGKSLSEARRILITLPDDFQEILVVFPVLQSLVQARPESDFLFLTNVDFNGFVAGLFGVERVLNIHPDQFYWGEKHLLDLGKQIGAFKPEISINLRWKSTPLLQYVLRMSLAPIRVQVSTQAERPFANLILTPSDPANHLRRFLQATRLWDISNRPIVPKWSRLGAGEENLRESRARIISKGLRPEATRLYLWQNRRPERERHLFKAAAMERAESGAAKSLLVLHVTAPLFATEPPPKDMVHSHPVLEVQSVGLLLGFFANTAYSLGVNGPLIQLAGIADTDVEAHFEAPDAVWDTGFLNPRLRVTYL